MREESYLAENTLSGRPDTPNTSGFWQELLMERQKIFSKSPWYLMEKNILRNKPPKYINRMDWDMHFKEVIMNMILSSRKYIPPTAKEL